MENNGTAKVISVLDYIGILWILGLFVEKDNADVKFHTNQGLILFILELICGVAAGVFRILPFIGGILSWLVGSVLGLACFVLAILGIVNAAQGQRKPLPVIGGLFQFIK